MKYHNGEFHFGSLDRRQLHLRFFAPNCFCRYTGDGFKFAPLRMLNPRNWHWYLLKGFAFSARRFSGLNHRCHCPVGYTIDVNAVTFGFGVWAFCSYYNGPVPCWCDKVIGSIAGGCLGCNDCEKCLAKQETTLTRCQ